ncbi:hypothetical protein COT60_02110 [Candidatus Pacearchaeota archaeon CG09_land_8_20_14_0_10_30_9]|nr:hypothetical protein [Candidatus Pacearchaeota archaeon]OIO40127.1 MAG: hypothetical protein AUJ61_02525 [Candidatus Pacearchaeota archaeon CG1_02_30_18]PIO01104.1 MAG: hypothetical protein COT60_02110 [Candidatus Pacearchaeota archaeon CG09_land_8_20_14_0_10_30_9]
MGKKFNSSAKIPKDKEENFIHIKLENFEAITSKKDLLSSEINLLKIFQILENYKRLRSEELNKRILILKKSKEIKKNLSNFQSTLPSLKIPKILKKGYSELIPKEEKLGVVTLKKKGKIEDQLLEIQEKLKSLSQ